MEPLLDALGWAVSQGDVITAQELLAKANRYLSTATAGQERELERLAKSHQDELDKSTRKRFIAPSEHQISVDWSSEVASVACTPTGLLAVVDAGRNSVTAYAADAVGRLSTVKELRGTKSRLDSPMTVAFNPEGNMFITSRVSSQVAMFAVDWRDGNSAPVKTLKGNRTGLNSPVGLAFDVRGLMYVTNGQTDSVTVYERDWDAGDTPPIRTLHGPRTALRYPMGLAFDADGFMHVANAQSNSVTVYSPDWTTGDTTPTKILSGDQTGLGYPVGITFDTDGLMYVSNYEDRGVTVYSDDWAAGNTPPIATLDPPSGSGDPVDATFDSEGNLWLAVRQHLSQDRVVPRAVKVPRPVTTGGRRLDEPPDTGPPSVDQDLDPRGRVTPERISLGDVDGVGPQGPPVVLVAQALDFDVNSARRVSALIGAGRRVLVELEAPPDPAVLEWISADIFRYRTESP